MAFDGGLREEEAEIGIAGSAGASSEGRCDSRRLPGIGRLDPTNYDRLGTFLFLLVTSPSEAIDTMSNRPLFHAARFLLACMATAAIGFAVPAEARQKEKTAAHKAARSHHAARHAKPRLDTSGRRQVGQASVYARKFTGRKMADGTRMNPNHDNAASKTLPLGSKAKVTNLETGQSAVVTIRDRGPHVKGRIVDLSPSTARSVGITPKQGVAKVEVVPIPGAAAAGGLKPGANEQENQTEKSNARGQRGSGQLR